MLNRARYLCIGYQVWYISPISKRESRTSLKDFLRAKPKGYIKEKSDSQGLDGDFTLFLKNVSSEWHKCHSFPQRALLFLTSSGLYYLLCIYTGCFLLTGPPPEKLKSTALCQILELRNFMKCVWVFTQQTFNWTPPILRQSPKLLSLSVRNNVVTMTSQILWGQISDHYVPNNWEQIQIMSEYQTIEEWI